MQGQTGSTESGGETKKEPNYIVLSEPSHLVDQYVHGGATSPFPRNEERRLKRMRHSSR